MKKLLVILTLFTVRANCFSQTLKNQVFLFDFDSTKIFVPVSIIRSSLIEDNLELKNSKSFTNPLDTFKIEEYHFNIYDSANVLTEYSLKTELFNAINIGKADMFFNQKRVAKIYSKKYGSKRKGRVYRKYFEKSSGRCFLIQSIYFSKIVMPNF